MDEKRYTLAEMQGEPPKGVFMALALVGLVVICIAALLPVVAMNWAPGLLPWWKWVYAAGALLFLVGKLFCPYRGTHPRIRRLYRIESWSAVFFCVAAFFLFYNDGSLRDVWAFTLAGGALLIFTTIAIPHTIRKELRKK